MSPGSPDFSGVSLNGYLGFPLLAKSETIELDGDIVLLTGANGAGKSSLLEAIALRETGGTFRSHPSLCVNRPEEGPAGFVLKFGEDNPLVGNGDGEVKAPPAWWRASSTDRNRHLRMVYFHPHYLSRLFEEAAGAAGTTFIDLLAPVPQQVEQLRAALKTSLRPIEEAFNRLQGEAGIVPEEVKAQERKQFAAELNASAIRWRDQSPYASGLLTNFSAERLVIKNGNLRNNWIGELGNLARQLRLNMGQNATGVVLPDDPKASESLEALALLSSLLERTSRNQGKPATAEFKLTDAQVAILRECSMEEWQELKTSAQQRHERAFASELEEKRRLESRDAVRRVRNAIGRGEGDFPAWLVDLRRRGEIWTELLRKEAHQVAIPQALLDWFRSVESAIQSWPRIESVWEEWAAKLDDEEKSLSVQLERMQVKNHRQLELYGLAEDIQSLAQQIRHVSEAVNSSNTAQEFLASVLPETASTIPALVSNAAAFESACLKWARRESDFAADEERQNDPARKEIQLRLARLGELRRAVATEAGTGGNARLSQLQQDALGSALKPLDNFLNEAIDRFRMFDSIRPIRLERFAKRGDGNRLAFRVGHPPREVEQTSSGQRSQLGLLMFLALHFGLRTTYPSKVICLDEITSSFDLAQIPRLALLLRQIAYAPPGSEFRRRIFIASHNEDFSQRLAELLTPPHGRSMRIVRFTGFDPKEGPQLESFRVQPAASFNAERIESYFKYRYSQSPQT